MGAANLTESFWNCRKRWDLERELTRLGWRSSTALKQRGPMCGAEMAGRILGYLDSRDDPQGGMGDLTPDRLEDIADYRGKPGLLFKALAKTGWIDDAGTPDAKWHDYAKLNGKRTSARVRQRQSRDKSQGKSRAQSHGQSRDQRDPVTVPVPVTDSPEGIPSGISFGDQGSPGSSRAEVEEILNWLAPNRKRQKPNARGEARELKSAMHYLLMAGPHLEQSLSADLQAEGITFPGALFARVAPRHFNDLVGRLAKSLPAGSKREGYARSSLAGAWGKWIKERQEVTS